jgi:phosphoribosylformimino-5-aminoimidazole carboxamide ribotide isomerase
MRIVPVIDLMDGQVVRGVAGQRESYRPVRSVLSATAEPAEVARCLADRLGRRSVYVADLGAIAGARPDWEAMRAISAARLELWVDAGIRDLPDARRLAEFTLDDRGTSVGRIIVGLESIAGPAAMSSIVRDLGPERITFSLDLASGRPLARTPSRWDADPLGIVRQVAGLGVRRMIVLDLAQVGTAAGVRTGPLCLQILAECPDIELVTGGGVSHARDLAAMAATGIHGLLVASAIHDGRLTREDIERVERERIPPVDEQDRNVPRQHG